MESVQPKPTFIIHSSLGTTTAYVHVSGHVRIMYYMYVHVYKHTLQWNTIHSKLLGTTYLWYGDRLRLHTGNSKT